MRSPLRLSDPPVAPGFTGPRLTACNLCEAICGLELTLTDGRVTAVRGNPDDPLSRGYICPKGVAFADVYDDPDRLRRPIVRRDDDWVEIGWDEALDLVARRLAETLNEHGRDAVGVYLGNPNVHALASATHGVPFVKALRTRNRFSATTVDQAPAPAGGVAAVRPPAADPDPRPRPHVVPPGARRQPDGVERLADDRAGLPDASPGDQGARRLGSWCSTRAVPRPPRSPPSTTSCARGPTWWCCSRCCARCSPRASPRPPAYVDGVERAARAGRAASRPSWPRRSAASRPRRSSGSPGSSARPTALRRTDGWGSRPPASARCATGRSPASTCCAGTSTDRAA